MPCFLAVDRQWISLAMTDEAEHALGKDVVVIRGEPDGGGKKRGVEPRVRMEIGQPWPYAQQAQGCRPA